MAAPTGKCLMLPDLSWIIDRRQSPMRTYCTILYGYQYLIVQIRSVYGQKHA